MKPRRALAVGLGVGCVVGLCVIAAVELRGETTPRAAAEEISAEADGVRQSLYPDEQPKEQQRDGIFVLVSASLGVPRLQALFDESRALGATVVFRGWPENDFKSFATLVRTVVEIPDTLPQGRQKLTGMHPANVVLDPVLFKEANVTTVPALLIRERDKWLAVTGGGTVKRHLAILTQHRPEYQPLLRWFERRTRGWLQGGETTEPRPVLPAISETGYGTTGTAGTIVTEDSLIDFLKRQMAGVNWEQKSRDVQRRISTQLKMGPGIHMPSVSTPRTFLVDVSVAVPDAVHDQDGNQVVSAGTVVNPLEVIHLRKRYVVLNGTVPGQVAFVEQFLEKEGREHVSVMITKGDVEVLAAQFEAPVFWVSPQIIEKFQIEAVPSVIRQVGNRLQVQEVVIEPLG